MKELHHSILFLPLSPWLSVYIFKLRLLGFCHDTWSNSMEVGMANKHIENTITLVQLCCLSEWVREQVVLCQPQLSYSLTNFHGPHFCTSCKVGISKRKSYKKLISSTFSVFLQWCLVFWPSFTSDGS